MLHEIVLDFSFNDSSGFEALGTFRERDMTVDTALQLEAKTKDELQDLLTLNIDSRDGFREAAEKIDDVSIGSLCQAMAAQRQTQADELAQLLEVRAERVERDGSISAAVHRIWMDIREALSTDNTHAILAEAERGEDHIKEAYENALKEIPSGSVRDLLMRHYSQVTAAHDRIRMLRDEFAS